MRSLRQDRFFHSIPGVTDEQFENSQFLQLYKQTEKCPEHTVVIDSMIGLQGIYDRSHFIFKSIENEPAEYDVVKTYSSDLHFGSSKFYTFTNEQLVKDNTETLKKLIPFIRRATSQINYHGPSQDCVVYRGMQLNEQQTNYFTYGKVFRFPGFTSTSKNKDTAKTMGNTLFEIHIFAKCPQVMDLTDVSYFQYEEEWLFSPYSRFQVTGRKHGLIVLKSIDNLSKIQIGISNYNKKNSSDYKQNENSSNTESD